MSGHSKWAQIKRQKGVNDSKRGQIFTKLAREIMVAARQGGADAETNFRLRLAIQRARGVNMPQENIQRAISRASGTGEGAAQLEEITYEGYGPGGVAIFVEAVTDNRNRTVAEVRNIFTRNGGSLGENGSVAWIFDQRGVVTVNLDSQDPDEATLQAIDAGATDVNQIDKTLEVYTDLEDLEGVRRAMEGAGLEVEAAERAFVPKTTVTLDDQKSTQVVRLIERLEDLDDVQNVSTNLDLSEELVAQLAS
jgi:YebC/PmpR family DNA-binding regulatory protein